MGQVDKEAAELHELAAAIKEAAETARDEHERQVRVELARELQCLADLKRRRDKELKQAN
jgi:hypothetical protein